LGTFPENFENKIGFNSIRDILKENCFSEMGRTHVDDLSFLADFQHLNILLQQTEEFRQILLFDNFFPTQDYIDMRHVLTLLRAQGTFIEQEELLDLKSSLGAIFSAVDFFQEKREGKYPALEKLCKNIILNKNLIKQIDRILDDKGAIRDGASPELQNIRKEKISKERAILGRIRQALISSKEQGFTEENVESTIRDGRLVIPVLTAYKRQVQGLIHDESASGRITYIEPAAAFELNNEIRDLINAEKREIVKILTHFTDLLRPDIDILIESYHFLGLMDFIRAKAAFAVDIGGIKPIFHDKTVIDWIDAIHPLLLISHRKQCKSLVPLTVALNEKERILVISGPNAGGKSICLKTIGLLQYMWQCGLLIPMKENSMIGIFEKLFIDIGDQQSLENDLSTYSSHLLNMKYFMENSDKKTLFLIDEFGTGTEPNLGGAIAEAVLENLNAKKVFGVVTTHYANLKSLPDRNDGIVNGAMLFDMKELKPTFKLRTGKPGSSFAFEIATKIGFPKQILEIAKEKSGLKQVDFDQQLQQLDIEKEKIEEGRKRLAIADEFLTEMIGKYTKRHNQLEQSCRDTLHQAKLEARQIVSKANQLIENTIREIRESQAEKERTKELRQIIYDFKKEIQTDPVEEFFIEQPSSGFSKKKITARKVEPAKKQDAIIDHSPIQIGDFVRLKGATTVGKISELKGKQALIAFDSVSMRMEIDRLEKIKNWTPATKQAKGYAGVMKDINERKSQFSTILDLRGMRAEDALTMVDKYIDEAVLLSIKDVRILHGKGNGILRTMIRRLLAQNTSVVHFEDESIETGGAGITLVRLD
jgi:DNA mismatch repair protein MutS2